MLLVGFPALLMAQDELQSRIGDDIRFPSHFIAMDLALALPLPIVRLGSTFALECKTVLRL